MDSKTSKLASKSTTSTVYINDKRIRIMMVGKTGVGKSATGNTILGKECFKSDFSAQSLTTDCKKVDGEVDGQKIAVIDSPGLFDTRYTEKKTDKDIAQTNKDIAQTDKDIAQTNKDIAQTDKDIAQTNKDIAQSISFVSPGPHIFLVVIRLGRFTKEEKETVQKIQEKFGEEANKYSMVLFTGGDLLKGKPIKEFLEESEDLKELVAKCNNQYHVFNNEVKDRSQVSELLEKIKEINEQNGGHHYTTEMFQNAERVIEEEKQRILKEKEEENRKEQEKLRKEIEEKYELQMRKEKADRKRENELRDAREREKEEKIKKLIEEQEEQARRQAEENGTIIQTIINGVKYVVRKAKEFVS